MSISAAPAAAACAPPIRGAPLKAIFYQTEKPTWYFVVHPSITQGSDLKGKKIGVALIGDSEDRFITLFAERAGVSAKESPKSHWAPASATRSSASKAATCPPWYSIRPARWRPNAKGMRKLAFLGDVFSLPFQGYVVTNQKLAENPAQVKRWIRAMTRSLLFIRERPEDAADIALRRLRIKKHHQANVDRGDPQLRARLSPKAFPACLLPKE